MDKSSASNASFFCAVLATSFGFAVVQLDVTIVNVALPAIASELQAQVSELQWVVDAYTLAFAVLLLSAGAVGDRFGSRRAYVAGFAIFALASLLCGVAPQAGALIAARVAQGIGAALLVPSSLALLSRACAHDDVLRARAVGWWTAAGGVSITAGPVVGALLLDAFGWRSIFFVNVPVCALGIYLTLRDVQASAPGTASRTLDPMAQLLAIVALTGLTAAIIESGHAAPWRTVNACGFAAVVAGALFAYTQGRSAAPVLPPSLFRLPSFTAAVAFGVLVNLTYYGVIFVLSLYLQQARGYSPLAAGLAYIPLTATFIVSNVASGRVTARLGPRAPMIAGAVTGMAGFVLLGTLGDDSAYVAMLPAFVLIPAGMGLAVPAMTTAVLASAGRAWSGTASGALNAARQMGGAIGVAAFGALLNGGHGHERIARAVELSALCSAALLLVAAVVAWVGIGNARSAGILRRRRSSRPPGARPSRPGPGVAEGG